MIPLLADLLEPPALPLLYARPAGGLPQRLRQAAAALRLAVASERQLVLHWSVGPSCDAHWRELFAAHPRVIDTQAAADDLPGGSRDPLDALQRVLPAALFARLLVRVHQLPPPVRVLALSLQRTVPLDPASLGQWIPPDPVVLASGNRATAGVGRSSRSTMGAWPGVLTDHPEPGSAPRTVLMLGQPQRLVLAGESPADAAHALGVTLRSLALSKAIEPWTHAPPVDALAVYVPVMAQTALRRWRGSGMPEAMLVAEVNRRLTQHPHRMLCLCGDPLWVERLSRRWGERVLPLRGPRIHATPLSAAQMALASVTSMSRCAEVLATHADGLAELAADIGGVALTCLSAQPRPLLP